MEAIKLIGRHATLEPLTMDHLPGLQTAAADGELWNLFFTSVPRPENMQQWFEVALAQQKERKALVFAIRDNVSGDIVGSTRYCNIEANHKRVEIGFTWYAKRVQRTAINTECKLMLLRHAFEQLQLIRVEFRTDWFNKTSQKAIERLGAKPEGILRNHMIMPDGRIRDTVVYSILNHEWPGVRQNLQFKLER